MLILTHDFVSVGDGDDALMDAIVSTGTGGAIYSTIQDLLQWAKSGLGDDLLSAESVEKRHEFKTTNEFIQYGLGIHRDYLGDIVPDWYGHSGDAFGSNTRAFRKDDGTQAFASAINSCGYGALHGLGFKILNLQHVWHSTTNNPPTPLMSRNNNEHT